MDELGISEADVIGVSQGGMIAQNLAIDRPELVNKLVLAVTAFLFVLDFSVKKPDLSGMLTRSR